MPQISDRNIVKLHKPSYRLVAQPDALKLVAAKAFEIPRTRDRRGRRDRVAWQQIPLIPFVPPLEDPSENSLYNELMYGVTAHNTSSDDDDEEASVASAPVEVPAATAVPPPTFEGAPNENISYTDKNFSVTHPSRKLD